MVRPFFADAVLRLAAGLLALTAPFAGHAASTPILPLKEIKPGMVGECRTVFHGTNIESFHFRVEGIGWDNVGPGRDTIWCRMLDDPTGAMVVAAGMSGSPCTIDGKLIGALAYGWTFNKDPIFGVQPIESMLEADREYGQPAPRGAAGRAGASGRERAPAWSVLLLKNPAEWLAGPRPGFELPLPLQMGRLSPGVGERIAEQWSHRGFFPLQGAGGGRARPGFRAELTAGATAAGVLAQGDFTAAATGTLTWREGDRVLAFGHPFTGRGRVSFPLAESEIISVVSSYERSFKMANLGRIVGTIEEDRISAVAGRVGPKPRMVPMRVRVDYPTARIKRDFKLEMVQDRSFTPLIYLSALLDFFAQTMERSADATIRFTGKVEVKDYPPVRIDRLCAGENYAWVMDLLRDNGQELSALCNNDLQDFQIESVELNATVEPVYKRFSIERIDAYPEEVKPGGTVEGWVTLRRPRESAQKLPFKIDIPEEIKAGEVEIMAMDSKSADRLEGRAMGFNLTPPVTAGELIGLLNDRHSPGRIYFYVAQSAPGVILQNDRLSSLPGSIRSLLEDGQDRREVKPLNEAFLVKQSEVVDGEVEGSNKVRIRIKP